ncbi:helix-turn-helix domain-containing protein [Paraburkholderia atlantica]|uniref:helix-turn-helix domain-containing protein n=1 Tax=Paraburkholderia atlantica TaxID=2654982 RepID=UPI003D1DBA4B
MISRESPASVPKLPKDNLGCIAGKLSKDFEAVGNDISFYRKCMAEPDLSRIAMPASERGFLVGVSLGNGHQRRILRGARSFVRRFEIDSIYIRDFSEDYQADMYGNFDFVLVELSRSFFTRLEDEHHAPGISGLICANGQKDPVLGHLSRALTASLEATDPLSRLFVEQMGLGLGTHIARRYGNFASADVRVSRGLSSAIEARAKELLLDSNRGEISIADIARECNLSRGYFIRAFAKSTGRTPHQWLLEQRTEQARQLLEETDMTLSEIAAICGFADQSHLGRVFVKLVGTTPGAWRNRAV